jgi:hypothetical protein
METLGRVVASSEGGRIEWGWSHRVKVVASSEGGRIEWRWSHRVRVVASSEGGRIEWGWPHNDSCFFSNLWRGIQIKKKSIFHFIFLGSSRLTRLYMYLCTDICEHVWHLVAAISSFCVFSTECVLNVFSIECVLWHLVAAISSWLVQHSGGREMLSVFGRRSIDMYMHVRIYVYTYKYTYLCMYMCMHVYVCMCVCVCVNICICMYIYIYIYIYM